ncbi:MAG: hypothetical protein LUF85_09610 [Bacteroides sp.]|nr:hypothetical protein [Bacteroides sp.]
MRRALYIAMALWLTSTIARAQLFPIDTVTFRTSAPILSATYYQGVFYCLNDQRDITRIDAAGREEPFRRPNVWIETLFTKEGKLITREPLFKDLRQTAYIEYQYDGTKFRRKGRVREKNRTIYADERFEITVSCSGEWGGTAYFIDKKTRKKYECAASCAIQAQFAGNSYILTTTSSHMFGAAQILRISDPTALQPAKKRSRKRIGTYESKSTRGIDILADSTGIMALTSFQHQGEVYHLLTRNEDWRHNPAATYIATIKNGKFEKVQQVADVFLWRPDNSQEISYKEGYLLAVTEDESGCALLIGIEKGQITIFRFGQE